MFIITRCVAFAEWSVIMGTVWIDFHTLLCEWTDQSHLIKTKTKNNNSNTFCVVLKIFGVSWNLSQWRTVTEECWTSQILHVNAGIDWICRLCFLWQWRHREPRLSLQSTRDWYERIIQFYSFSAGLLEVGLDWRFSVLACGAHVFSPVDAGDEVTAVLSHWTGLSLVCCQNTGYCAVWSR